MGPGTFVVLPPLLCTALCPFRSVPLSAPQAAEGTVRERSMSLSLKGARNPRLISDPVKKQSVASVT